MNRLRPGSISLRDRDRLEGQRPRDINWPTPLLLEHNNRAEVLFQAPQELAAYDPATGRKLWAYTGEGMMAVPSLAAARGIDRVIGWRCLTSPSPPSIHPPCRHSGQRTENRRRRWSGNQSSFVQPTHRRCIIGAGSYVLNNSAILLNCADVHTGKVIWQQRVKGPFSASPVAADGKLYLVNEDGLTTVLRSGDEPQIVSSNALGEPMLATPAIVGGAIYLHSAQHLYCIAQKKAG